MRDALIAAGFSLEGESDGSTTVSHDGYTFIMTANDVLSFISNESALANLREIPCRGSLCSSSYREQVIRSLEPRNEHILFRFRIPSISFGAPDGSAGPYVTFGPATDLFMHKYRIDLDYLRSLPDSVYASASRRRAGAGPLDIQELFFRPYTIRVTSFFATSHDDAIERTNRILDACIFELGYLKRMGIQLADDWPHRRRLTAVERFNYGDKYNSDHLPSPRSSFNPDLVRFYQFGMSSDIPVLQFLAYYQVLEYFFLTVSDEHLYAKLSQRLNDPRFSTVPKQLDRVIQDVAEHKRSSNETEMLKAVLVRFVDKADLAAFITEYQTHLGEKVYTKKRGRFGTETNVNLDPEHIFDGIAGIVKAVRNALVHSSDRYDRNDRHVPFSKSTEIVRLEVPLLKYLAERVIIGSATPTS